MALGSVTFLAALGMATIFIWRAAFTAPYGKLHVTILYVRTGALSGDGILIRTPSGRNLLIDGGPSARSLSDALGRRLPPTDRGLDWLVVAAPGDEQTVSLPQLLERFSAANVLWAGPTHGTDGARNLQAALVRAGISPLRAVPMAAGAVTVGR